ncbi:MAG TPA: BlaI/MecI/CopY family transcriptional regulator [Bacteroidetes bacterium]|nr:BlaI/MecI/CopY family transcriptional regulator [Bacteroidota bacterium]
MKTKELTKAEEQVMEYLWKLERAFVRDVLEMFPNPRPAYTTVSTIVRILEQKGMVDHTAYGKNHQYYPVVSRKDYARLGFKHVLAKYFNSSVKRFASFFAADNDLSLTELEEMKAMLEQEISKRRKEDGHGDS